MGTEGDNTKLLSKYNLYVGSVVHDIEGIIADMSPIVNPTGIQDEKAIAALYNGDDFIYPWIGTIGFNDFSYWDSNGLKSKYGTNYPAYVYDSNASIKTYVDNYKNYLETQGLNISEARIPSFEEIENLGCSSDDFNCKNAPSWVYLTSYWTGTAINNINLICVVTDSDLWLYNADYTYDDSFGVRPVIIIPSNQIQ